VGDAQAAAGEVGHAPHVSDATTRMVAAGGLNDPTNVLQAHLHVRPAA
jgi:hypothetical protein